MGKHEMTARQLLADMNLSVVQWVTAKGKDRVQVLVRDGTIPGRQRPLTITVVAEPENAARAGS
jgi:hypothetical protein